MVLVLKHFANTTSILSLEDEDIGHRLIVHMDELLEQYGYECLVTGFANLGYVIAVGHRFGVEVADGFGKILFR